MKRIFLGCLLMVAVFAANAQKDENSSGFKKQNLFTGGGIQASFYTGGTVLGISPTIGYSINKYLDAGINLNFTYAGQTFYNGDKDRLYVYGPGVYAKFYPIKFLFLEGSYEYNITSDNYFPVNVGTKTVTNLNSSSLLLGGGYCTGRQGVGGNPFFYLSILFDVTKDANSPYVQPVANGVIAIPIIKGGIQIPLFQEHVRHRGRY